MSIQERVLMRKIKKMERHKLDVFKQKEKERQDDQKLEKAPNAETVVEAQLLSKRPVDSSNRQATKKQKKSTEECSESNNELSEDEKSLDSDATLVDSLYFSSLKDRDGSKLTEKTFNAITDMGFTTMTEIQAKSIPKLLDGYGFFGVAKTGSGKTLAFLIPVIELIHKVGFKPRNGTGAIILCPTRELCMQTFGTLKELVKYHHQTVGLAMGGGNRKTEARKLFNGVNILVATPGRLLDHMKNTPGFMYKNLICLVIDEADRMFDIGFEEEIKQIVQLIPSTRQTMLFSATKSKNTDTLTKLLFTKKFIYMGVDDDKDEATVTGLTQGLLICPLEKRLLVLFTFLRKSKKKKIIVFFSSKMSVKFHDSFFNYIDLPVMCMHGDLEQSKRTSIMYRFSMASSGVLLCTDIMARGIDIPAVDWIIQYDPPTDPKEYIHRVGRTARGVEGYGHAVLILREEEAGFANCLIDANVPLNDFGFLWDKLVDKQELIESTLDKNPAIKHYAKDAFRAYIRSYNSYAMKSVFDVKTLDHAKLAKSFGLSRPPPLDPLPSKKTGGRHNKSRTENYSRDRNSFKESARPATQQYRKENGSWDRNSSKKTIMNNQSKNTHMRFE